MKARSAIACSWRGPWLLAVVLVVCLRPLAAAQETVFTMLKSDERKAAEFYAAGNYQQALQHYQLTYGKVKSERTTLAIARCHVHLQQPAAAATWYARATSALPPADMLLYADARCALGQYDQAVALYQQYLSIRKDDPVVLKKIWGIRNREFLFEDSAYYNVVPLDVNSGAGDMGAVFYREGFVFMSNRKRPAAIEQVDGDNAPFYKLHYAQPRHDTVNGQPVSGHTTPEVFAKDLAKYHAGPASFFNSYQQMVYAATGGRHGQEKKRQFPQLFFARGVAGSWKAEQPFPFNNPAFTFQEPSISPDGSTLYFSSDIPGGFGGKDLYRSDYAKGQWSKPVNLGETINTPADETSPFIHGTTLYFASTGHPGLGGRDIFHASVKGNVFDDVQNIGYPLNTAFDDFSLSLNAEGTNGFLTSNRQGKSDDVYGVTVALQSYPFVISGLLRYREESWRDADSLRVLGGATLYLIDHRRNETVQTTRADDAGNFELSIPYFSQYRIRVVSLDGTESFIGLELSRRRREGNRYEMVVVKNPYKDKQKK